jgi:indole-3-glycerol phosphate synthase
LILDEIIDYKKIELAEHKKTRPFKVLEQEISKRPNTRGFLVKKGGIQLIAELKKASPSRGIIRKDFDPDKLSEICENSGASALSVLTDEKFFKGSLDYLSSVRERVDIPLLRKDFIIDEYQILEARAFGADAVLLLANVLKRKEIQKFLDFSRNIGLQCLVETHTEDEIKTVLDSNAEIIGINNRDLKTFIVDIKNTERLIKNIPNNKVIISESGICARKDIEYLEGLKVDAVLIGESIMTSNDVSAKIKELLGI